MINPETVVSKAAEYKILFDLLEEAKNDQPAEVQISFEQDDDLRETIALFNEYQNSEITASFSTITVG